MYSYMSARPDLGAVTALAMKKVSPPFPWPYLARMALETPEMDRLGVSFDFQQKN